MRGGGGKHSRSEHLAVRILRPPVICVRERCVRIDGDLEIHLERLTDFFRYLLSLGFIIIAN